MSTKSTTELASLLMAQDSRHLTQWVKHLDGMAMTGLKARLFGRVWVFDIDETKLPGIREAYNAWRGGHAAPVHHREPCMEAIEAARSLVTELREVILLARGDRT